MVSGKSSVVKTDQHELEQVVGLIEGSACLIGPENTVLYCNNSNLSQPQTQVAGRSEASQPQVEPAFSCQFLNGQATGASTADHPERVKVVAVGDYLICTKCNTGTALNPKQMELYKSVVEKQSELICRVDIEGRLTYANSILCTFLGKNETELYSTRLQDLVTKGSVRSIDNALAFPAQVLKDSLLELYMRQPQGKSRCTRWSVSPVENAEGKLEGMQLTGRDITNQKVYYEELLKYQEQLRNLTGRLIMTEEIERRRIAQGLHDDIGHNLTQASNILGRVIGVLDGEQQEKIITDSLDLIFKAQESARSLTFELSPPILFDVGFVAALEWLAGQIQNRHGITITFNDDGEKKTIDDEVRVLLYHSVRELLINIVKHAKATEAEIIFSVEGNNTVLTVQDNGQGFDPGKLSKPNNEHRGYGHFTIAERVSQLSGTVDIISSPGKGTKVTLTTPQGTTPKGTASNTTQAHPGSRKAPDTNATMRVMLVDDHELIRKGLKLLLDDHEGIDVVAEASDGLRAVELALQQKPDVIVMDINMPKLGGIQATSQILEKLPNTRVIALSSHHDKTYIKDAFNAGAIGYMLKDSVHDDLVHAIRTASSSLRFISDKVFNRILADFTNYLESAAADKLAVLSNREREVLGFIADGITTKAIAMRLGLSAKTIETYRRRITEKLNLDSVAELTKYALQKGLTDMPS